MWKLADEESSIDNTYPKKEKCNHPAIKRHSEEQKGQGGQSPLTQVVRVSTQATLFGAIIVFIKLFLHNQINFLLFDNINIF